MKDGFPERLGVHGISPTGGIAMLSSEDAAVKAAH